MPEVLAAAVDAQRAQRREQFLDRVDSTLLGRPAPHAVRHLLSGLIRCTCGATFEAQSARYGQRKGGIYLCSAARRKGRTVCASRVHLPAQRTEALVIEKVERDLLDADVFGDVLDVAVRRLMAAGPERNVLTGEYQRLGTELTNLAAAVAAGGDLQTLLIEIRAREVRRSDIERQLRRPLVNHDGLLQALHDKLADWKRLLRSRRVHGQTVLRTLLEGPIVIGALTSRGVTWEASVDVGGILETLSLQVASPAGPSPFSVVGRVAA